MKLSDLKPEEVEVEQHVPAAGHLKLSDLSPEDYVHESAAPEQEKPGMFSRAMERVSAYTDAPARSAVMAAIKGKNPLSAFGSQFGAEASTAPTGEDIAAQLGASKKPVIPDDVDMPDYPEFGSELPLSANLYRNISPAQAAGAGIDVAVDPKNIIPYAGGVAKAAIKSTNIGEGAVNAFSKLSHSFTGVPAQDVATYIKEGDKVKDLIARSKGDLPGLADAVRDDWSGSIGKFKAAQNDAITAAKAPESAGAKIIAPDKILDALESEKAHINPHLEPEKITAIKDLQDRVRKTADGGLSLRDLDDIRDFFQSRGKSAYIQSGQMFNQAPEVAKAAKTGGSVTRAEMNTIAPKSMQEGYSNLSKLHGIDDELNQNLLSSGRPDSALFAAGSGTNQRNAKALKELGELIGHDTEGDLRRLGAARTFANPPLLPMDTTGKSMLRAGLGVKLGGWTAEAAGIPSVVGQVAGGALTSPAALKLAIDAGRFPIQTLGKFAAPIAEASSRGAQALQTMHRILSADPEYAMRFKFAADGGKSSRGPADVD